MICNGLPPFESGGEKKTGRLLCTEIGPFLHMRRSSNSRRFLLFLSNFIQLEELPSYLLPSHLPKQPNGRVLFCFTVRRIDSCVPTISVCHRSYLRTVDCKIGDTGDETFRGCRPRSQTVGRTRATFAFLRPLWASDIHCTKPSRVGCALVHWKNPIRGTVRRCKSKGTPFLGRTERCACGICTPTRKARRATFDTLGSGTTSRSPDPSELRTERLGSGRRLNISRVRIACGRAGDCPMKGASSPS